MPVLNNYPGAEAAFSLRKLRSAHSGSAVRIRRDSDNAEQDIGFSGNDLDTTALTAFVGSASAYVATWYDQSGNANDTLQTVAQSQPQLVDSGALNVDLNGVPTVVFDGSDDFLISAAFGAELTQPSTYFTVAKLNLADGSTRTLTDGQNGLNRVQTTTAYGLFAGSTITGGTVDTDEHVLTALFNGASSAFRVDGTEVIQSNPGADSIDLIVIGADDTAAQPWSGTVSEVIFYNSDQSANYSGIEANQTARGSADIDIRVWRGTIEPLEVGGSGNEAKLWRGAIEPAAQAGGGLIGHNDPSLRHNDITLRHMDTTLRHRDTTLRHNR